MFRVNDPTKPRPTNFRYYVLAALCVITIINYIQRNSVGGLVAPIVSDLRTDDDHIGDSGLWFFFIYALFQIPTGVIAQRYGPRRALAAYAVGWSLASIGMAVAGEIWGFIAFRGLMGALQAGIFPCATLIMSAWLPASQRAFASALLNSCMLIGGALVYNLTAVLLHPNGPLDWRELLVVYALPGFVFAAWFYWWFRNSPEQHPAVNQAERDLIATGRGAVGEKMRAVLWAVVLSVPLWLICIQQFMRAGGNRFVDQWLSRYLQLVPLRDFDETSRLALANQLASFPQYGGVVGGLIGGLISDWVLRRTGSRRAGRNGVAVVSLGLTVLAYLPVFGLSDAYAQIVFFTAASFIAAFAAPCAYALSMDVGGKNLPIVFGAMNMVGNFGAAAITWIVPRLNRWTGSWDASLIMLVAIHAVALICWLFLNPNRTVGERE
jgi:ACS family glucarate transporter-like MFS transporter